MEHVLARDFIDHLIKFELLLAYCTLDLTAFADGLFGNLD